MSSSDPKLTTSEGSAAPSQVYKSVFASWHQGSSVRSRQEPEAGFEADQLFFSPDHSPLFLHPAVVSAPADVQRQLLTAQLYVYLRFTVYLELGPVNEVCNLIRQPDFLPWLPTRMKHDVLRIYTDEGYHATFSKDLIREAVEFTEVPEIEVQPAFLRKLDELVLAHEPEMHALIKLFFVIISETLITGTLAGVPKDPRVQRRVRDFVEHHRVDEGRHHQYFSTLFGFVWPRLPKQVQRTIGMVLPDMILTFLEPDTDALVAIVASRREVFTNPGRLVDEIARDARVMTGIEASARHTLKMLSNAGVFDDPAVVEAFHHRGFRAVAST